MRPDRWAETSVLSWFGLPVIAIVVAVAITAATGAATRHPELWNLPRKAEFLALPAAARATVEESLHRAMAWTSLLATLALAVVHANVYRVAIQHSSAATPFGAFLPVIPLAGLAFVDLVFAIRIARQGALRPHGYHGSTGTASLHVLRRKCEASAHTVALDPRTQGGMWHPAAPPLDRALRRDGMARGDCRRAARSLPGPGLAWLVTGGALYTGGVVFYVLDRRVRFAHAIWHIFVLAGSAAHFWAVLGYTMPRGVT